MNAAALKIREAVEADLPSILALYSEVGDAQVLPPDRATATFERMKMYPDYHVYVATIDGTIVGTFALLIVDNLAHLGAPSGVVEDVVVSAERRGQGIGKQMMQFAMGRCRERGCYKMALSSNITREAAHRFYESLGFERHGYSFCVWLTEQL
ncbi:MAG TPA: GNAT family N-acetyltransferase [Anaerolineae bacterium]